MTDDVLAYLPHLLAVLVVAVAVPLTWYVAWLLWRMARADGEALHLVAVLSTGVALIVTVFAAIFVNNGMAVPVLNGRDTQIITRGSLLILSVIPALLWLRWYRSGNSA